MNHSLRRLTCLCLLGAIALAATNARAETLAEALTGQAKTEYDAGRNLLEIHDDQAAFLKFKRAYELSKDARLLWNMAICQKELRHYAKAVALVDLYLEQGGDKLSAEMRANAVATRTALNGLHSEAVLTNAPAGASVFVDDEPAGTTPLAKPIPLDVGAHVIRLEHPDYETATYPLKEVTGGQPVSVAVTMKPRTGGQLHVLAGAGDTIAVDGTVVGTESWRGEVKPGSHTVRVSAKAKKPYVVDVDMKPRGSRSLQVSLQDEATGGPIWPWIAAGAAVVAGVSVVGGYFLFAPQDGTAPPPAGKLGTVTFATFGR